MVRGAVVLPFGTGKQVRVCVFASGAQAEAAAAAGAGAHPGVDQWVWEGSCHWGPMGLGGFIPSGLGVYSTATLAGTWSAAVLMVQGEAAVQSRT